MKNTKTKGRGSSCGVVTVGQVNKLIVRPLGRRISCQGAECLKQGRRILEKIKEVDESIAIIARQMKRQLE